MLSMDMIVAYEQAAERLVDSALIAKLEEPTLTVRGMPQIGDVGKSEETGNFAVRTCFTLPNTV